MRTPISREVTRVLLPFIYLFAFYVMIYGHLSPGGGFAGGSILAAGMVLEHVLFRETSEGLQPLTDRLARLIAAALLLYGLIKCLHFFNPPHSGFHIPVGVAGTLLSGGTLMPLNLLIGVTVGATFTYIAILFEEGGTTR